MAIVRWQPLGNLLDIRKDIDKLFEEFFEGKAPIEGDVGWTPRVDVHETDNSFVVSADIPGLEKKDIKISMQNNVLTIFGERKMEREEKNKSYHRIERYAGKFSRSFQLPTGIDADNVKAAYKNGVLTIEIPKKEEAKAKEIPVEVE